jgi:hypothetical protein
MPNRLCRAFTGFNYQTDFDVFYEWFDESLSFINLIWLMIYSFFLYGQMFACN